MRTRLGIVGVASVLAGTLACTASGLFDAQPVDGPNCRKVTFYRDLDGDGWGDGSSTHEWCVGTPPPGWVLQSGDCQDRVANVHPRLAELCDAVDNDCSSGGGAEPAEDRDGDRHSPTMNLCNGGPFPKDDCDDARADVYGGAVERCDGVDENCDGRPDDTDDGAQRDCVVPRATSVCRSGPGTGTQIVASCVVTCDGGRGDCDGDASNGCETDLASSATHCGRCGSTCGAGGACRTGLCAPVTQLAAGDAHTCALRSRGTDGFVACWGDSSASQVGAGAPSTGTARVPTPVAVPGIDTAVEIAAGASHTCARLHGGRVSCWGSNFGGALGALPGGGTTALPVSVWGLTDATGLALGQDQSCALRMGGDVVCWGEDWSRSAGDYRVPVEHLPVPVTGVTSVAQIVAGARHVCALDNDGSVRCWGSNDSGALGIAAATAPLAGPTTVPGVARATGIAAGADQTCALVGTTSVLCWGGYAQGPSLLRDPSSTSSDGRLVGVRGVALGWNFGCATVGDAEPVCWSVAGLNEDGQLGALDLPTQALTAPVHVSGLVGATGVVAGQAHACVFSATGQVVCWGRNASGQVGDGTPAVRRPPTVVKSLAETVWLAAGDAHTCARRATGVVHCWGSGNHAQLGRNHRTSTQSLPFTPFGPLSVVGLDDAVELSAAGVRTCVRHAEGTVSCWGATGAGWACGTGGSTDSPEVAVDLPAFVAGVTDATAISVATEHACALVGSRDALARQVRCWGRNGAGELGNGTYQPTASAAPVRLDGTPLTAVGVAAGDGSSCDGHTCAVAADGSAWCWGSGARGQLGNGSAVTSAVPVPVRGLSDAVQITAGLEFSCARRATGRVACWGANDHGQLGDGTFTPHAEPATVVGLVDAVDVVAAGSRACAIRVGGEVVCWGSDDGGLLGDEGSADRSSPVAVHGLAGARHLALGTYHTCARVASGDVFCWGRNDNAQLADGTTVDRLTPIPLPGFP